ncbi:site-specific integrase [Aestuariibacter sp. GS-14]|uniref:site-specific integrase n=1 Tax=Aestuariibacter sp. GS-14 TaxID=2590670 RepID=UPI00112B3966|nr:site-specific integrase [Aestuariibacter sp. GS-14]TPV52904.1 site-specific integrase [Aestuariibacter sp. GS-14]
MHHIDFEYTYKNHDTTSIRAFYDSNNDLLILPTLFSLYTSVKGVLHKTEQKVDRDTEEVKISLKEVSVSSETIYRYMNELSGFLSFLESQFQEKALNISLHVHENASSDVINYYINEICVKQEGRSSTAISKVVSALDAYYNYLALAHIAEHKSIYVSPTCADLAKENTRKNRAIKYISKRSRSLMLRHADCLLDKLILRCGAELGLRTKENLGLRYHDFEYGKEKRLGIKSLIEEAESNPSKQVFEFYLAAKWTKHRRNTGGRSRTLYIRRDLLLAMNEYIKKERPSDASDNALFIQIEPLVYGLPIPENKGTTVFREVRKKLLGKFGRSCGLDVNNRYHHLRHTFGTEKFYELSGGDYRGLSPESAVMLEVARLMGHSTNSAGGSGNRNFKNPLLVVTRGYIRSCMELEQLEAI